MISGGFFMFGYWRGQVSATSDLAAVREELEATRRIHMECCGKSAMERDKAVSELADLRDLLMS